VTSPTPANSSIAISTTSGGILKPVDQEPDPLWINCWQLLVEGRDQGAGQGQRQCQDLMMIITLRRRKLSPLALVVIVTIHFIGPVLPPSYRLSIISCIPLLKKMTQLFLEIQWTPVTEHNGDNTAAGPEQ